jgi:hypothetical protein
MASGDVVLDVTKVATSVINAKVNVASPTETIQLQQSQVAEFRQWSESGSNGWNVAVDRLTTAGASLPGLVVGKSYQIKITEV